VHSVNNSLKVRFVVIINFDVIECVFFLSFELRMLCAPLGVHTTKRAAYPNGAQSSGFLNNVLPEDDPVWPKHVAQKHGMYIYIYIY
jgi:hypothetical protein